MNKSIDEIVEEKVQAALSSRVSIPDNKLNQVKTGDIQEVVEPSPMEAPKPGRRKKVISEPTKNA
ncbi:MAG: hypothetical protein IPI96_15705 [Saprospiraceae bacterium]|nr:hypothetical protein [Saprospiraceae bacterium]